MMHDAKLASKSLRTGRAGAMALVMGLAALTAQATESGTRPRHPALLRGLLAKRPARPRALGRLHAGSLLPPAGQGSRRRTRPEPRAGRGHAGTPRAGPGDRHGPQAGPAGAKAPATRRPAHPRPRPRPPAPRPRRAGRGPGSRPPRRSHPPVRTRSSNSGPAGGPSPTSGPSSACPPPAFPTRSTKPSASSNVTSPIAATTSTSATPPSRPSSVARSADALPVRRLSSIGPADHPPVGPNAIRIRQGRPEGPRRWPGSHT